MPEGRPRLGLGAKMTLAMVGSLTVLLALLGFNVIRQTRRTQEAIVLQSEDRLGDLIRRATRSAMLRNDRDELDATLPEIGRQPQLLRVRIYDKSGTIRYSSRKEEVGMVVDMKADACDRCHATAQPLTRLERPDRTRIYRQHGQRVMGTIQPLFNEDDCMNAACHAHPEDKAVLGVLDVQMSLHAVDETVARSMRNFILTALLTLALVSAISVLWVWRTVHRPVRDLLAATRAISAGNLETRVPDELGSDLSKLVASFNQMTADLRSARRESEDWARSLEVRVEEKSRALRRAQDEMVQVEKMASLGKLAAIVAHEINNPLAGIRTYAKLLLKKAEKAAAPAAPAAETAEWLSRIESEAARCGDIVRNLLSFARSSQPRIEPTNLSEVVLQSVRLVQHQLDLAQVQAQVRLPDDLPTVECDPQQIKQALLAILINACEAMPQGGTLTVGCESSAESIRPDAEGHSQEVAMPGVELLIRDTGVGMDAEMRKHAFEPFFTTKEGTALGGTGLGLAVVYSIVRSHGGTVSVESTLGGGSLFRLWLPCAQAAKP
jgi:two-component system, NtrC family, sensor kinase